jgi:hypothetical protein
VQREDKDFCFVWTKKGRIPRKVHHTPALAEAEAQRLAAENPGQKFIVLRAYTAFLEPKAEA